MLGAPADFDVLVERTGLPAARLRAMLLGLELRGLARALPGGRWDLTIGGLRQGCARQR